MHVGLTMMIPTATRALTSVWRLNTLRIAKYALAGTPPGTIVDRALFGHVMPIDLGRSDNHRLLYLEGERFIPERTLIASVLRPGMRVVDAGANIGYYVLLFRHLVGPSGHVTAVEPLPGNLRDLERVRTRNGFANVSIESVALGQDHGTVHMWADATNGADVNGWCDPNGPLCVAQAPLDAIVPQADFIKIDVEGFEGHVLAGAERLLRTRPTLFVEIHPASLKDYTLREVMAFLSGYTVRCFRIADLTRRGKIRAQYRSVPLEEMHGADIATQTAPFWAICT